MVNVFKLCGRSGDLMIGVLDIIMNGFMTICEGKATISPFTRVCSDHHNERKQGQYSSIFTEYVQPTIC